MASECIHGFDEGLCDICFPKAPMVQARPAVASRAATRSVTKSGSGSAQRESRAARSPKAPPVNLLDQRVYHVTHVNNLAGIIASGAVLAPSAQLVPTVDLSSPLARELRATAEVAPAREVAAHVSWYLSTDATVWQELRRGAAETRWSAAARAAASVDFVVLVSTVRALSSLSEAERRTAAGGAAMNDSAGGGSAAGGSAVNSDEGGFVVADGDAAGTFTRFASGQDQALRMLSRLHNTDDALGAEVLVFGAVPFSAVQLIGVANEPHRDRVRAVLESSSTRPKVAVYPPWFAAPE